MTLHPRGRPTARAAPVPVLVPVLVALAALTLAAACTPRHTGGPVTTASPVAAVAGPNGEVDTSGQYSRDNACLSANLRISVDRIVPADPDVQPEGRSVVIRLVNSGERTSSSAAGSASPPWAAAAGGCRSTR